MLSIPYTAVAALDVELGFYVKVLWDRTSPKFSFDIQNN
jgi:hypothetical protein